jgi:hypothetical protein
MRVRLMSPNADFDPGVDVPPQSDDLVQDLQVDLVLDTMAAGDAQQRLVARAAMMSGVADVAQAQHRHEVLTDCDRNRSVVEELFSLCGAAMEDQRTIYRSILSDRAESHLHSAVSVLEKMVPRLRTLRQLCDEHAGAFESTGFCDLFDLISQVIDEDYLARVTASLEPLRFRTGLLLEPAVVSTAAGETSDQKH